MANRTSLVSEKFFRETLPTTRSAKIVRLENLALYGIIYMTCAYGMCSVETATSLYEKVYEILKMVYIAMYNS